MNTQKIKKLAQIAAENSTIPHDIERFVLTAMTKSELKSFLNFYTLELSKNRVEIVTPFELSASELSEFKKIFGDKDIFTSVDKSLGAGIKVRQYDTIVDFTIKSLINETIDRLKN